MKFLALGDSYTIGENVTEKERWPLQLAALLRDQGFQLSPPDLIARTGWTTAELNQAITLTHPTSDYDLVSLLIGVNNQYRGQSQTVYRQEFKALLQRAIGFARGEKNRVLVLSIPDWGVMPFAEGRDRAAIGAEIDAFNLINAQESAEAGVHYVDVTAVSRLAASDDTLIASDGLHPSGAMYTQWAQLALPSACQALHNP